MRPIDKMQELIKQLNKARDFYYNKDTEIMTNKEYDFLYDELEELEKKCGFIIANSPTQTVGYEVKSELKKVNHIDPLLSLAKTKSVDELIKFAGNRNCLLAYKLDGLTVEVKYENGELVQAQTRGNGEVGELITHNALTFINLPKTIPYKKTLRVVGEAVIDYETFEENNKTQEVPYKNPRNLVSGSVRQLDSAICAERNVKFFAFKINEGLSTIDDKYIAFANLTLLGIEVCPHELVQSTDIQECLNSFSEQTYLPIDGAVLTYVSRAYSDSLDSTSHHPKHSIAFKWQDSTVETVLRDILVDVGKSGQVSYTAKFDPVDIEGSTVEKATLHNYQNIKNLQLGIGDRIRVYKANLVIPQVDESLDKSDTYQEASHCPYCDTELEYRGVHQFCPNYDCPQQAIGRIVHWCSRDAMNIDGVSEETIRQLNSYAYLDLIEDLYGLDKHEDKLVKIPRFGKRKVEKIFKGVENSKKNQFSNVLYGLSIPSVGRTASKKIANKYLHMHNLLQEIDLYEATLYDTNFYMELVELVGQSIANSLIDNLKKGTPIRDTVNRLILLDVNMEQEHSQVSNTLEGKTFVVTGSVGHFSNRKELQAKIESLGGKVSGSVSKNTDYLINNDKESSSNKNKKAKSLNIPIISEDDFLKLI